MHSNNKNSSSLNNLNVGWEVDKRSVTQWQKMPGWMGKGGNPSSSARVEANENGLRFVVPEKDEGMKWLINANVDIKHFPYLVVYYCAKGLNTQSYEYFIWGSDKKGPSCYLLHLSDLRNSEKWQYAAADLRGMNIQSFVKLALQVRAKDPDCEVIVRHIAFRKDPPKGVKAKPVGMVLVPPGEFFYGLDKEDIVLLTKGYPSYSHEVLMKAAFPRRRIHAEAFYIDKYPVTNRQFAQFVGATGYTTLYEQGGWSIPSWRRWYKPETANHPVTSVSREDAFEYCKWRTEITGRAIRLPTRLEWEKAARGTDGRRYPWGNTFDLIKCNTSESHQLPSRPKTITQSVGLGDFKEAYATGFQVAMQPVPEDILHAIDEMARQGVILWMTTPVDTYAKGVSPYGVWDMVGNVREWVSDDWEPVDPLQAFLGLNGICCGGGWDCSAPLSCPAFYVPYASDVGIPDMGFRCAANA